MRLLYAPPSQALTDVVMSVVHQKYNNFVPSAKLPKYQKTNNRPKSYYDMGELLVGPLLRNTMGEMLIDFDNDVQNNFASEATHAWNERTNLVKTEVDEKRKDSKETNAASLSTETQKREFSSGKKAPPRHGASASTQTYEFVPKLTPSNLTFSTVEKRKRDLDEERKVKRGKNENNPFEFGSGKKAPPRHDANVSAAGKRPKVGPIVSALQGGGYVLPGSAVAGRVAGGAAVSSSTNDAYTEFKTPELVKSSDSKRKGDFLAEKGKKTKVDGSEQKEAKCAGTLFRIAKRRTNLTNKTKWMNIMKEKNRGLEKKIKKSQPKLRKMIAQANEGISVRPELRDAFEDLQEDIITFTENDASVSDDDSSSSDETVIDPYVSLSGEKRRREDAEIMPSKRSRRPESNSSSDETVVDPYVSLSGEKRRREDAEFMPSKRSRRPESIVSALQGGGYVLTGGEMAHVLAPNSSSGNQQVVQTTTECATNEPITTLVGNKRTGDLLQKRGKHSKTIKDAINLLQEASHTLSENVRPEITNIERHMPVNTDIDDTPEEANDFFARFPELRGPTLSEQRSNLEQKWSLEGKPFTPMDLPVLPTF